MAKVKPSGVIDTISGKLGGSLFLNTPNGVVVKQNSFSQQPKSPSQTIQRVKIGQVSQLWQQLDTTQKANWQAETVNYPYTNKLGLVSYYTAYQLFCKLNLSLQAVDEVSILNAPSFVAVSPSSLFSVVAGSATLSISYNSKQAGNVLQIWATRARFTTLQPKLSEFRLIYLVPTGFTSGVIDIIGEYGAVFGDIRDGSTVCVALRDVNASTGNATQLHSIACSTSIS